MFRDLMRGFQDPRLVFHRLDRWFGDRDRERQWRSCDSELERARSVAFLSEQFDCDAAGYLSQYRESLFLKEFREALGKLWRHRPRRSGTTSLFDCETMYLTVRALKPQVAVETGVLYGALTSHVLEAMDRNGGGRLVSLDLAETDPGAPPKDHLVPPRLRERVQLVLGDARETLPRVLGSLKAIDLFSHDSLHSVEHMTWEYITAHRFLRPGGVLASHDVLPTRFEPSVFVTVAEALSYEYLVVYNFGVARKPVAA